jgi:hypothetical protein
MFVAIQPENRNICLSKCPEEDYDEGGGESR